MKHTYILDMLDILEMLEILDILDIIDILDIFDILVTKGLGVLQSKCLRCIRI